MPCAAPVCRIDWIWKVLFSRIRFADGLVHDEGLDGRDAPFAVRARDQPLGDHGAQRLRQHGTDLPLRRPTGTSRSMPIDRADRIVGVQGREHEVTGLGRGERERDRLEIAQLADHDHVRVLAQRRAQRAGEGVRVPVHTALIHQAAFRGMHVLDGILDREDVLAALLVDQVRRARRASTTCRSRSGR